MRFKKTALLLMASTIMFSSVLSNSSVSAANHARVGVHDPSIVKLDDGSYYIAGSHLAAGHLLQIQMQELRILHFSKIYIQILQCLRHGHRHPIKIMICQETFGHRILFIMRYSVSIVCI